MHVLRIVYTCADPAGGSAGSLSNSPVAHTRSTYVFVFVFVVVQDPADYE